MTTRSNRLVFSVALAIASLAIASTTAQAQVRGQVQVGSAGVGRVLANFETMAASGRQFTPDEVLHPENYSRARADSVLDGLERIALTGSNISLSSSAAQELTLAGSVQHAPPHALDRAVRLYRQSKQKHVRNMILSFLPLQKDRARTIAFLKSVAVQGDQTADFERAPFRAAESLGQMGPAGRAALIDLRDAKLLRDGDTIAYVNWFLHTH